MGTFGRDDLAAQIRIARAKSQRDLDLARQLCRDAGLSPDETPTPPGSPFPTTFLVFEGTDNLIGTATVLAWPEGDIPVEQVERFQLGDFVQTFSKDAVAAIDNVVIPDGDTNSIVTLRLLGSIVNVVNREADIHFLFLSCPPASIPLYEKAGCRKYGTFYKTSEGSRAPLCLVISDHQHLVQIGSPLLRIVQKYGRGDSHGTRTYFQERWLGRKSNAQDSTATAATDVASPGTKGKSQKEVKLRDTKGLLQDTTLFDGLNHDAVSAFLEACPTQKYKQGDPIIRIGEPGTDLLMFVLGYADVVIQTNGKNSKVGSDGPGDVIGELNTLLHTGRTAHVIATSDVEVIRIPETIFRDGVAGNHLISARLNFNIPRILADRLVQREQGQP